MRTCRAGIDRGAEIASRVFQRNHREGSQPEERFAQMVHVFVHGPGLGIGPRVARSVIHPLGPQLDQLRGGADGPDGVDVVPLVRVEAALVADLGSHGSVWHCADAAVVRVPVAEQAFLFEPVADPRP